LLRGLDFLHRIDDPPDDVSVIQHILLDGFAQKQLGIDARLIPRNVRQSDTAEHGAHILVLKLDGRFAAATQ
jgi:hypothetical protein